MMTALIANPAAATSPCRRVRSATKPPPSTPKALAVKNAVSARFAVANGNAKAPINATTEKLLMPLVDRLRRMKKTVSPRMAGLNTLPFCCACGLARATGCDGPASPSTPGASSSGTATTKPIRPATISAAFIPTVAARTSIVAGAIAPPNMPAKVCTEKALPMREAAILAERMA